MSETASHLLARMQCRNTRDQDEVLKEMERLLYLLFGTSKIRKFKPIFYHLVNESLLLKNPNEDLQEDNPKVIIVDCRQVFDENEFYKLYPQHEADRSTLAIYRPTYEGSLMAHTQSVIKDNLVGNIKLKLIIVFAPSSRLFKNVATKFHLILHRTPIMCKTIFVWDSLDKAQILMVNRREISQAYTVDNLIVPDESEVNYHVTFSGTKNRNDPQTHEYRFTIPENSS